MSRYHGSTYRPSASWRGPQPSSAHWERPSANGIVGLGSGISVAALTAVAVAATLQMGQQRAQNDPRWNMGRCIFSDRPPHIRHALVTAVDWMHRSMESVVGPGVEPIPLLDPRPALPAWTATVVGPLGPAFRQRRGRTRQRRVRGGANRSRRDSRPANGAAARAKRAAMEHGAVHLLGPAATHQARAGHRCGLDARLHGISTRTGG